MREKLPFLSAAVLIFLFLFSVFTPAHEYPMRTEQVMTVVFEAGILLGLIVSKAKLPAWLFWTALACGLGLFAIRFTSDAAWWTGHLMYSLGAR